LQETRRCHKAVVLIRVSPSNAAHCGSSPQTCKQARGSKKALGAASVWFNKIRLGE